jgi:succinyl-CoA synthetase alpha subunit
MSILLDEDTTILVQGITGKQAERTTANMISYGSTVVAGVRPGKGGTTHCGVPIYDTVHQSVEAHDVDVSMVSVPPLATKDAVLEAVDANVDGVIVLAEGVPAHDASEMIRKCRRESVVLVGPNSQGVISPGKAKIGGPGGDNPARQFRQGNIGIISRSGGMGAETAWMLKQAGYGVSTYLSIGGDGMIGFDFEDALRRFNEDSETRAVVLFGELGTSYEERAGTYIGAEISKPVVAFIAGKFTEDLPQSSEFGHAGALIRDSYGTPSSKEQAMRDAGVYLADEHRAIPTRLHDALGN